MSEAFATIALPLHYTIIRDKGFGIAERPRRFVLWCIAVDEYGSVVVGNGVGAEKAL